MTKMHKVRYTRALCKTVSDNPMEKQYDPKSLEPAIRELWEGRHSAEPSSEGQPYCMMLPPPNVTGVLHMGHAFQISVQDALCRYYRLKGRRVHWQLGTDHAGIATQMVVERRLQLQGESREGLGREVFTQAIWDFVGNSKARIIEQFNHLGGSGEWSKAAFTLDKPRVEAVKTAFIRLYEEGFIYRGPRLVNWDPALQTAVSDLEVISTPTEGYLYTLRYALASGEGALSIATTRPETIFADVAVAVHPDDPRYQEIIGQEVIIPVIGRAIPIIADPMVEIDFGTGVLKITPAHDFNDDQCARRHALPYLNILDKKACLTGEWVPEDYQGLSCQEAREKILGALCDAGLLIETAPHTLAIPRGEKSGAILEPRMTTQWFLRMSHLAKPALEALHAGELVFYPSNWGKTYEDWLLNIEDWCLSRQLWWGHRIPAWYDEHGEVYVGKEEALVRERHGLGEDVTLSPEEDVLDTWFSSALWPFSTLGWSEGSEVPSPFYPNQVLVTGFDIIFFWVARMVMFGLKFTGKVPFKEVYITPLVRDPHGQKMSKSKGNVIDPIDVIEGITLPALIEKNTQNLMQFSKKEAIAKQLTKDFPAGIPAFGTDPLRFAFCSSASPGRDIHFDFSRLTTAKHFANKLWNAARFVSNQSSTIEMKMNELHQLHALPMPLRWFYYRLKTTSAAMETHFAEYRFDLSAEVLYELVWGDYCDWLLEISKVLFAQKDSADEVAAFLKGALAELLKLMHPLMPFITESIWQSLYAIGETTLANSHWPEFITLPGREEVCEQMEILKALVGAARGVKARFPQVRDWQLLMDADSPEAAIEQVNGVLSFVLPLEKIEDFSLATEIQAQDYRCCALIPACGCRFWLVSEATVDIEAERARLSQQLAKLEKNMSKLSYKLHETGFVDQAPANVVAAEQEKWGALVREHEALLRQRDELKALSKE